MCEHKLKLLSPPVVDVDVSLFGGGGYTYPPIFQCIKCLKVFKTGWHENELVEILINELSDEDKKKMSEHVERKRHVPFFWFTILIIGILLGMGLLIYLCIR